MRRKDRELTELGEILQVVERCKVCRLAMADAAGLYLVPMNFGYAYVEGRLELYFHSAREGRKVARALPRRKSALRGLRCRGLCAECGNSLHLFVPLFERHRQPVRRNFSKSPRRRRRRWRPIRATDGAQLCFSRGNDPKCGRLSRRRARVQRQTARMSAPCTNR